MAKKKQKKQEVPEGDLHKLLECDEIEEVTEFVSTGSTLLNYAISNKFDGGFPVGRISELIGENQAGKTLIATHTLAETQKKGGIAICIDVEHDMDKQFSYRVGLSWEELIYKEWLETIQEVFEYIEKVITTTRIKYKDQLITIVWDSIGATKAAQELEMGYDPTAFMGLHARIMSMGLRKIRSAIKSERIVLLCTNQLRTKIGVSFGDATTTPHGKAMSFYASVRVKLAKTKLLQDNTKRTIGAMCEAKVIKNKCGPGWRKVYFPLMYDWGIDDARSIMDELCDTKVITRGGWNKITVPGKEEIKFRSTEFGKLLATDRDLNNYVMGELDKNMVITFDRKPDSFHIDTDSILEMEQVEASKKK